MTHAAPASLLTIFGATGDLARRMLLPSLYSLQAEHLLPANLRILGTARSELDREGFANLVSASIGERIPAAERDDAALRGLLERLDYAAASVDDELVAEGADALREETCGDVDGDRGHRADGDDQDVALALPDEDVAATGGVDRLDSERA